MSAKEFRDGRLGKIKAKNGASLVIVICISAFLAAFALAMVYSAGLLMSRANRRLKQERCYQLAQSFAQTLDAELKYYKSLDEAPEDSFYGYACNFLEGLYGEYDPDHPDETIFHYTAASPEGVDREHYGDIKVILYKEANQEQEGILSGELTENQDVAEILNNQIQRYSFTVEVEATLKDVSFLYSTEYRQWVTCQVTFRHDGNVIVWNPATSKWNSLAGGEYVVNWDSGNIQYELRTDSSMIRCEFKNAYQEKGTP